MKVIKRDGNIEDFNLEKIKNAINKAMDSVGEFNEEVLNKVVNEVYKEIKDRESVLIEDIQDIVENILIKNNLVSIAKEYILYRDKRRRVREQQGRMYEESQKEIENIMALKNIENANANVDEGSFSGKNAKVQGYFLKEWALNNLMSETTAYNHRNGIIYQHDLDNYASGMHNCFGRETKFITNKGTKSFNDFNDGDEVTVLTHTGEWKKATVHCYGKQQLNRITFTKNGRAEKIVRATNDHRWMLKDGTFTTNLKIGDSIYPAPIITNFDFDNSSKEEQRYWRMGFALGDGTIDNNWDRHNKKCTKANRTKIKLCGDKLKFLNRFISDDCYISSEKFDNGDKIIKLYDYHKEIPIVNEMTSGEILAFVDGLYCADGYKTTRTPGIQFTGCVMTNLVFSLFETAGYFITSCKDKTNTETNFGKRSDITIEFLFGINQTKYYKVKNIKPDKIEDVWCLDVEDNHTFVLSGGLVTGNCLVVDFTDLYENEHGFKTRNGDVREPSNIMSFMQLVAVVFQAQSQCQFGK